MQGPLRKVARWLCGRSRRGLLGGVGTWPQAAQERRAFPPVFFAAHLETFGHTERGAGGRGGPGIKQQRARSNIAVGVATTQSVGEALSPGDRVGGHRWASVGKASAAGGLLPGLKASPLGLTSGSFLFAGMECAGTTVPD